MDSLTSLTLISVEIINLQDFLFNVERAKSYLLSEQNFWSLVNNIYVKKIQLTQVCSAWADAPTSSAAAVDHNLPNSKKQISTKTQLQPPLQQKPSHGRYTWEETFLHFRSPNFGC